MEVILGCHKPVVNTGKLRCSAHLMTSQDRANQTGMFFLSILQKIIPRPVLDKEPEASEPQEQLVSPPLIMSKSLPATLVQVGICNSIIKNAKQPDAINIGPSMKAVIQQNGPPVEANPGKIYYLGGCVIDCVESSTYLSIQWAYRLTARTFPIRVA